MSSSVRVEALTPARYRENYDIEHAFLGSKKFCCVLPWSCCGGFGEWRAQREKQAPEHKALYAVAIDESTSKVLGFVHCCGHGMKCDLHTPKPGELYVEELAVSAEARGKGVGTKLLQWAEAQAVARGDTVMSLAVLRGNRAQGLYERFGFEEQPHQDGCDECCECCFVTLCFGRPYGCCHAGWGSAFMTKSLLEKPAVVVVNAKGPVVEAMERASEDVIVESGVVVRPRGLMRQASLNRALSR